MDNPQHAPPPMQQQNLPSLVQPIWNPKNEYAPPKIILHNSVLEYTKEVSRYRPVIPNDALPDVLDLLRDVKRLADIKNETIIKASIEILMIAEAYKQKWSQTPGLRTQMLCTDTRRNHHVRMFWTTMFGAWALMGQIVYYDTDDEGMTVFAGATKRHSRWATVPILYRDLSASLYVSQPSQHSNEREESTRGEVETTLHRQQRDDSRPGIVDATHQRDQSLDDHVFADWLNEECALI